VLNREKLVRGHLKEDKEDRSFFRVIVEENPIKKKKKYII